MLGTDDGGRVEGCRPARNKRQGRKLPVARRRSVPESGIQGASDTDRVIFVCEWLRGGWCVYGQRCGGGVGSLPACLAGGVMMRAAERYLVCVSGGLVWCGVVSERCSDEGKEKI